MNPIIKWAGSKRQLLPELKKRMPKEIKTYVEPFFGSGALFFEVMPETAIINDYNYELINMYSCIRDKLYTVKRILAQLQTEYNEIDSIEGKADFYYKKREKFNKKILFKDHLSSTDAALLIFLNKSCYNGLYRVNTKGFFNTPFGKKENINLFESDNIKECAELLKRASITTGDFEKACIGLKKNDFVYFDSPYYDTFDTYQAGGFPESEHIRLAKLFRKLTDEGVNCMLSNSDTNFIKKLYEGFEIDVVPVKRMINCNGKKRTGTEVIITNY